MLTKRTAKRLSGLLASLAVALAAGVSFGTGGGGGGCWSDYYGDRFSVCFYTGTNPATGTFIQAEWEGSSGYTPPYPTLMPISRDWPGGQIIAGDRTSDVSAVWKGSFQFDAARYQFSVITDDGVRIYIDDALVIDQWQKQETNFANVRDMTAGSHRIRIEWFASPETWWHAGLKFHWNKLPASTSTAVHPYVVDALIAREQQVCIAGQPWTSGNEFTLFNSDGTTYRRWQQDSVVTLKPSDPNLSSYQQVECVTFGFRPEEITYTLNQLAAWEAEVENWSSGGLDLQVQVTQFDAEITLTRLDGALRLFAGDIRDLAATVMDKDSDFALAFHSVHDVLTGRYTHIGVCGNNFGSGPTQGGLWGAPYVWIPNSVNPGPPTIQCLDDQTMAYEWNHTMDDVFYDIMKLPRIYPPWPACGNGDPDTYKWYPNSNQFHLDPVSPWCGVPSHNRISTAHNLQFHFDRSLSHYQVPYLTGNHCDNDIQDFDEAPVDEGSNCPVPTAPKVFIRQPFDGQAITGQYTVKADVYGQTQFVEFYVDGALQATDGAAPYEFAWTTPTPGLGCSSHIVRARTVNQGGLSSEDQHIVIVASSGDWDADAYSEVVECYVGTDIFNDCPLTATPNDESIDAWPPDMNDDRSVNATDRAVYDGRLGAQKGFPNYVKRYDLNDDGKLTQADVDLVGSDRTCT